jgi:hypothetical protein
MASVVVGGTLMRSSANTFFVSLLVSNLVGWVFLLLASWHVPRSWRNIGTQTTWRPRLQQLLHGSTSSRTAFRRKLVSVNPFFWLASRSRFDPYISLFFVTLTAALLGWLFWKEQAPVMFMAITLMVILHLILRVNIAGAASRHFAEQRRSGALEFLLACTPMDTKDIVRGQWMALRRQFLVPILLVLLVDGFFIVTVFTSKSSSTIGSREQITAYLWFSAAMVAMLLFDCVALGWVGMWMGISQNKANRASGATLARVMVWPCAAATLIGFEPAIKHQSGYVFLAIWFVIGMICNSVLIVHSRKSLYANFRKLAATPYEEQSGLMAAIGRALGTAARPRSTAKPPPIPTA